MRRRSIRSFALLILCFLLTTAAVVGKKDKDEKDDENEKGGRESPMPSDAPSIIPSSSPTMLHSLHPSTMLETASLVPTVDDLETSPPTDLKEEGVFGAALPLLEFAMVLTDENSSTPTDQDIEVFYHQFLNTLLQRSSGKYSIHYVELLTNIRITKTNQRRLENGDGLTVTVDGFAYYVNESPTRETLARILKAYFSLWGIDDLEGEIEQSNLRGTAVASVVINEEEVAVLSDTESDNIDDTNSQEDDGKKMTMVGVILAAVTIILIPIFAFVVFIIVRRCRGALGVQEKGPTSPSGTGPVSPSYTDTGEQDSSIKGGSEDGDQSLFGAISVDMSIFTTTMEGNKNSTYDEMSVVGPLPMDF